MSGRGRLLKGLRPPKAVLHLAVTPRAVKGWGIIWTLTCLQLQGGADVLMCKVSRVPPWGHDASRPAHQTVAHSFVPLRLPLHHPSFLTYETGLASSRQFTSLWVLSCFQLHSSIEGDAGRRRGPSTLVSESLSVKTPRPPETAEVIGGDVLRHFVPDLHARPLFSCRSLLHSNFISITPRNASNLNITMKKKYRWKVFIIHPSSYILCKYFFFLHRMWRTRSHDQLASGENGWKIIISKKNMY